MTTQTENTTAAAMAAPSVAIAAPGIPVGIPLDTPIQRTGQTITIGLWLAGAGGFFAFLASIIGWLGVVLSGSDTSSNSLFGPMQTITAQIFLPLQDLGNIILMFREADASLQTYDALMRQPVETNPDAPIDEGV